jgi:hypothetical protein
LVVAEEPGLFAGLACWIITSVPVTVKAAVEQDEQEVDPVDCPSSKEAK